MFIFLKPKATQVQEQEAPSKSGYSIIPTPPAFIGRCLVVPPAPAPPSTPLLHLLVVHAYNSSEISFKTSSHGVAPDSLSQWLPHCKKGHIPFAGSSGPDVPAIRVPITSPAPNSLLPHLDIWLYRCQG